MSTPSKNKSPLFIDKIDIVSDDLIGKVLGNKYQIEQFYSEGSHGTIYLARDVTNELPGQLIVKI